MNRSALVPALICAVLIGYNLAKENWCMAVVYLLCIVLIVREEKQ